MRIEEILAKLDRVTKTSQGWKARCPAHEDDKPSLSVTAGDDRVLLKCHANCDIAAITAALGIGLSDLFAPKARPAANLRVEPAAHVPAVAGWLMDARSLPPTEVETLFATGSVRGPAVAFAYRDERGSVIYYKVRPINEKTFWRKPAGTSTVLYGLETLRTSDGRRVVVTEGELDAHSLRAVVAEPVASLPDGAGSRVTPELVAPLRRFAEVLVATDADTPGDDIAAKLAVALGGTPCRRVQFTRGSLVFKDANEALCAGCSAADFAAAFAAATPMSGGVDVFGPCYRVHAGRLVRISNDRDGSERVDVLCNFQAEIAEEITIDDGAEQVLKFRIRGARADGRPFGDVLVLAEEFAALNWVTKHWGARAVMFAGSSRKEHLRAALLLLSNPTERTIISHTGWHKTGETWSYFHDGGVVGGAADVEVKLGPTYERFSLPLEADDPAEAMTLSLSLLECGPPEVMVPLLASVYLAPLASILSPDFALWLVGTTGSLKSELAALAQRHFGAFDRKSLPGSWSSTANALEGLLFTTKDMLTVIDDFAPQADAVAQKEQTKRAETVLRNIGNHAGRARLRADLSQRPVRPPRCLCLCTGEDHPATRSIIARLVLLHVDRDRLNFGPITRLQERGDRLRHAMRAYVGWLAPQMPELERSLRHEQAELVSKHFVALDLGPHLRGSSGITALYIGLDLAFSFASHLGLMTEDEARLKLEQAAETLKHIARAQGELLRAVDPVDRYVEILKTLLDQHKVFLRDRDGVRTSAEIDADEMIGWRDKQRAYLLPDAARRAVGTFMRDLGEAWEGSSNRLHDALVKRRLVEPAPNGKPYTQLRFEGERHRVLVMPLWVLFGDDDNGPVTPPVTGFGSSGDASCDGPGGQETLRFSPVATLDETPSHVSHGFASGERQ